MSDPQPKYNVTVIGIGAMGGGMARALLLGSGSSCCKTVTGYDRAQSLVDKFHEEAVAADKALLVGAPPTRLQEAVTPETNVCILVLLNEAQCEQVCFGDDENLCSLLSPNSFVFLCSTVTPAWALKACEKFQAAKNIKLIDCPTSGGPVRALNGDLTLIVSCNDDTTLRQMQPILDCLGRSTDIHHIKGGTGKASMVKMVHQLLAGVHIVAAAEALSLAAAAGLDVQQMFNIVNGAAGASWMFRDRGERMINSSSEIKSMLDIFVKDLDIVYAEAKRLKAPTPMASTALQQFISGQGLGLGQHDDSQVVQVYENVTGTKVCAANPSEAAFRKEGSNVGDFWKVEGTLEEILEVGQEPRHQVVLQNEFVRALRVSFPPNDTTLAHRHDEDSLYFFLVPDLEVVNHIQGFSPCCDCMELGEVRYGTHKTEKPLVHKISNKTNTEMLCIDAEILLRPPVTSPLPLVAEHHELIKTRDKCRVYKLTLQPGESAMVSYPFFHFTVVLHGGTTIEKEMGGGRLRWTETLQRGDVAWKEPIVDEVRKTNTGTTTYAEFIAEWC